MRLSNGKHKTNDFHHIGLTHRLNIFWSENEISFLKREWRALLWETDQNRTECCFRGVIYNGPNAVKQTVLVLEAYCLSDVSDIWLILILQRTTFTYLEHQHGLQNILLIPSHFWGLLIKYSYVCFLQPLFYIYCTQLLESLIQGCSGGCNDLHLLWLRTVVLSLVVSCYLVLQLVMERS